ncbi:MAG: putative integral rane protein [Marmoricola sp.]|nr:putative integral rane protein [Marmoricola sp.]
MLRTSPYDFRSLLNKVPEVTLYFWIIKILCTTVAETAADHLNSTLGLGLTYTSYLMTGLLVVALALQFAVRRYVPPVYWAAVALVSMVGTLITDNLTDNLGVPLPVSTAVFAVLLAGAFAAWYHVERTLSIHAILTRRREGFYWLAILFTFALGTAAGDLVAGRMNLGTGVAGLVFGGLIAMVTLAWWRLGLNPVIAFWVSYVLTRPLGATIGDLAAQSHTEGGLGLGTTDTSAIYLAAILALVGYLSITGRDRTEVRHRSTSDLIHGERDHEAGSAHA